MKKCLCALMTMLLCISLTACASHNSERDKEEKQEEIQQQQEEEEEEKTGYVVEMGGIDAAVVVPDLFIFHSEGPSPQSTQYDYMFQLDSENEKFKGLSGWLDIARWSHEEYPYIKPETHFSSRKSLSEYKKQSEELDHKSWEAEFYGTEEKYIAIIHSLMEDIENMGSFSVLFVDLNNNDCEYRIDLSILDEGDFYASLTDEQFDEIYQIITDMALKSGFID